MKKNRLAVTSLEREKTDPFSIFDISRAIREITADIIDAEIAVILKKSKHCLKLLRACTQPGQKSMFRTSTS